MTPRWCNCTYGSNPEGTVPGPIAEINPSCPAHGEYMQEMNEQLARSQETIDKWMGAAAANSLRVFIATRMVEVLDKPISPEGVGDAMRSLRSLRSQWHKIINEPVPNEFEELRKAARAYMRIAHVEVLRGIDPRKWEGREPLTTERAKEYDVARDRLLEAMGERVGHDGPDRPARPFAEGEVGLTESEVAAPEE